MENNAKGGKMRIIQKDINDENLTTFSECVWHEIVKEHLINGEVVFRALVSPQNMQSFRSWDYKKITPILRNGDEVYSWAFYLSEYGVETEIICVGFLEDNEFVLFLKPRYAT